jgi:hypothetical protein
LTWYEGAYRIVKDHKRGENMLDLVQRAARYAAAGHKRIEQTRKYTGEPYDVHLKAVAELVESVTDDPEMIAAAWLHDLVEDTPVTVEDIEREFGPGVGRLVAYLTDVSRASDGNRAARKAIDRAHLAGASPRAKTIKLADLIDNCLDISQHDARFARVYLAEASDLLEVLPEGHAVLYERARQVLRDCAVQLHISTFPVLDESEPDSIQAESLFMAHKRSLRLFARSFSARDIAEPLRSFDKGTPLTEILPLMEKLEVPVVGIRNEGLVRYYINLSDGDNGDNRLRAISKTQVLHWDAPLSEVILSLTRQEYVFVSVSGSITGVISHGDMEKPTMRMWLFGMITLMESELTNRIAAKFSDQGWAGLISPKRLQRAQDLWRERNQRNQPCSLISCLQLSDKARIALQDKKMLAEYGLSGKSATKQAIKELESLRNRLAHGRDIVSADWAQVARMAQNLFRRAYDW